MLLAKSTGLRLSGCELLLLSLLSSTFTAFATAQSTGSGKCSDVHLFLARGDQEDYPGRLGQISTAVCNDFGAAGTCDYEDIVFTTLVSTSYCDSCFNGSNNGIAQVQAYNKKCPNAMLVLAGYSLGAQIVGNILGGGGGHFYNCQEGTITSPFDPNSVPGNMIAGVLLLGDTRHIASQPYNVGTGSDLPGQYPRSGAQLMGLNRFSSVIQNYCLLTDPICAGGNDGGSHTTYMDVFGAQAGTWTVGSIKVVEAKLGVGGSGASSSPSTADTSSTASPSTIDTAATTPVSATHLPTSTPASTTSPSAETGSSTPTSTPGGTTHTLSSGAKAGIAVGVVAFVALLGLSAFFFWRRKQQQQARYADAGGTAEAGAAGAVGVDTLGAGTVGEKENVSGDATATPDTGSTQIPDSDGLANMESGTGTGNEPAAGPDAVGVDVAGALGAGATGPVNNQKEKGTPATKAINSNPGAHTDPAVVP